MISILTIKKVKLECTSFMFKHQLDGDADKIKKLEKQIQRAFNHAVNHSFVLEVKFNGESNVRLFRVTYNEKKKSVMISGGNLYNSGYGMN